MSVQPVLVSGQWRESAGTQTFQAVNPATTEPLSEVYPVSPWPEIEEAVLAAAAASRQLRGTSGETFARFLEQFATNIEARAEQLVAMAHAETALPVSPRLKDVELPRTTGQLRQAAAAARSGDWSLPTIDSKANIRSMLEPLGPVVVIGPNNFPFAFNSAVGGDFAAAVAAGNPVIAKGHPAHPTTTRLFAEAAFEAVQSTGLPPAFVQLIYRTSREDGLKLVSHSQIAASGFTGSRSAGMQLKAAAEGAGRLFYAELSSINPVAILAGAIKERGAALAEELAGSALMGTGQFCTNPGLILLPAGEAGEAFASDLQTRYQKAAVGTLLAEGVRKSLLAAVKTLTGAGADLLAGGTAGGGQGFCVGNTLLKTTADKFLANAEQFQTEAFGNATLLVMCRTTQEMQNVIEQLEGNLTGCIYSETQGADDAAYAQIAPALRTRVGRLLNDKMPTGVAVSPAMNHGGPFPATGHPGFTAVGIPASMRRFGMLCCYDNVRPQRLPALLCDNYTGPAWRQIDGQWCQGQR